MLNVSSLPRGAPHDLYTGSTAQDDPWVSDFERGVPLNYET